MFPRYYGVPERLKSPIDVETGTIDVFKKGTKNFFGDIGIIPVKVQKLVGAVFKRSGPKSFAFVYVDFGPRGRFID